MSFLLDDQIPLRIDNLPPLDLSNRAHALISYSCNEAFIRFSKFSQFLYVILSTLSAGDADLGARPPLFSFYYYYRGWPDWSPTARVQRMLVHLVYLVYLVCLVDRTGNSSRGTRQTRKTGQPDRRARARCASKGD
jgi:hypothetical protein